jgi:hypothetical protein
MLFNQKFSEFDITSFKLKDKEKYPACYHTPPDAEPARRRDRDRDRYRYRLHEIEN